MRDVLIVKQRRRRREALAWSAKGGAGCWERLSARAYRLWLAGVWLVALAAIGNVPFGGALRRVSVLARRPDAGKEVAATPDFQPVLYAVDALLPTVSLGQDTAWNTRCHAMGDTASGSG